MKIQDLQNIIAGRFDLVNKAVGVLLHDSGFMRYKKLTPDNYYYWWYEVEQSEKINKKSFTYDWNDMEKTRKFGLLTALIGYHQPKESISRLLNNALNILEAAQDGINMNTGRPCVDEVFEMYYSGIKVTPKQLELFTT